MNSRPVLLKRIWLSLALIGIFFFSIKNSTADEFKEVIEKDYPLRSLGEIRVTNARGDIVIDGWSQDRIRMKATRKAQAPTLEDAHKLFAITDIRFNTVDKDIELAAEYGRGLKIEERLKERNAPQVAMDLNLLAPANLPLRVWAVNGKVIIKGWNANLEVRTTQGPIEIESVRKGNISVLCPSCSVRVKSVHSSVRCMGGAGSVDLSDVLGSQVYVESDSGAVTLNRIEGDQLYVTKSASIQGNSLKGRIEFHTHQGSVKIADSSGFVSGRTESGEVSAEMKEWFFADKALIESISGNVSLALPSSFAGEVDLRSRSGKVSSAFALAPLPVRPATEPSPESGKKPLSRLFGLVNEGGDQLKLASEAGNVSLLKLAPSSNR